MTTFCRSVLALVLGVAVLLAGCNKGAKYIEEARQHHEAGDLEEAIECFEKVETEAPGTAEVDEARKLAAQWLIEAADGAKSDEKLALLEQAVSWDEDSGQARARICVLHAEAGKHDELRKCLRGLEGKSDAPEEMATQAQKVLDEHDQKEKEAAERKRLAASDKPEDWKALTKKYPESAEAKKVEQKLRKHTSICGAKVDWGMTKHILELGKRGPQIVFGHEMPNPDFGKAAVRGVGDIIKRDVAKLNRTIKEIEDHAHLPGEEPVKRTLIADYKLLVEMNMEWAKATKRYTGSLLVFDGLTEKTNRVAETVLAHGRTRMTQCLDLPYKVAADEPGEPPTSAEPATHEVYGTAHDVDAPYLALRSGPGTQHALVGKMPDGTRVRVLRKQGYWRFLRVVDGPAAGKEGYGHGGHVRPIPK